MRPDSPVGYLGRDSRLHPAHHLRVSRLRHFKGERNSRSAQRIVQTLVERPHVRHEVGIGVGQAQHFLVFHIQPHHHRFEASADIAPAPGLNFKISRFREHPERVLHCPVAGVVLFGKFQNSRQFPGQSARIDLCGKAQEKVASPFRFASAPLRFLFVQRMCCHTFRPLSEDPPNAGRIFCFFFFLWFSFYYSRIFHGVKEIAFLFWMKNYTINYEKIQLFSKVWLTNLI